MYLFFLMTRYLPISSLFPYTTLFRSVLGVEMCRDRRGIEGAQPPVVDDGGVAVHGALLRSARDPGGRCRVLRQLFLGGLGLGERFLCHGTAFFLQGCPGICARPERATIHLWVVVLERE